MIQITQEEYERLLDRDAMLNALEAGGVDNWDWYCDSLEPYNKEKERKAKIKKYDSIIDDSLDNIQDSLIGEIYEPSERGTGFAVSEKGLKNIRIALNKLLENILRSLDNEGLK